MQIKKLTKYNGFQIVVCNPYHEKNNYITIYKNKKPVTALTLSSKIAAENVIDTYNKRNHLSQRIDKNK